MKRSPWLTAFLSKLFGKKADTITLNLKVPPPVPELKLSFDEDQLAQIMEIRANTAARMKHQEETQRHAWRKVGALGYRYVYRYPETFGTGSDAAPVELLARLLEIAGYFELDSTGFETPPTMFRLKPGKEMPSDSDVRELYLAYEEEMKRV
jgi:hypothetical protein